MAFEEELFESVIEDEELMGLAREVEGSATFSEESIVRKEVTAFTDKVLSSAKTFRDWLVPKLKGLTVTDVVMFGTGVIMLYELIEKHAQQSSKSGKTIALSDAIKGARQTLETDYDKTIVEAAKKQQSDPNFSKWPKEVQDTIISEATMNGEVYWLTIGPKIMEAMATMPIYDASH
jgi:hypothetical protein